MKIERLITPFRAQDLVGRRSPHDVLSRAMPIHANRLPELLFLSSYPPRECGIATYTQDLIHALNAKFSDTFKITVCPLETDAEQHRYPSEITHTLNTDQPQAYRRLAHEINSNSAIKLVVVQHEFGLFQKCPDDFQTFLEALTKPIIIVLHTVLPAENARVLGPIQRMAHVVQSFIVMTQSASEILQSYYDVPADQIEVIPHGTHLVPHSDRVELKQKYKLGGRKILSTFGLLSSGKGIEMTLEALPAIVAVHPSVLFLIIGKTHPSVVRHEGERYRHGLQAQILELGLGAHVKFVDYFLPLSELLEYLQLTDIYLFTSRDPHQAVSGTFSYAAGCGCPIISTPIPHAREVLSDNAGVIIEFGNVGQLANEVIKLLGDDALRESLSYNGLHKMASTAWENAAIAHALLFQRHSAEEITLHYRRPVVNLEHLRRMTTSRGMIQFSKLNVPDIASGYTLDDNARAMIVMCQHFEMSHDVADLKRIQLYLDFIRFCQHPDGYFLNYVGGDGKFTAQNDITNLADANGRAIWALGYLISMGDLLPASMVAEADAMIQAAIPRLLKMHSTRAMAFAIKGLYYRNFYSISFHNISLITELANRLLQMYKHEAEDGWQWFESYLTYANSVLPEAMLCAFFATGDLQYREVAKASFDFLLAKTFVDDGIRVICNKTWLHRGHDGRSVSPGPQEGGEQAIDVAYTILALSKFHNVFKESQYLEKLQASFDWFLGKNHLHRVVYNPCTGGCYDGLEIDHVNLNQGAESTISYLMARLTVAKIAQSQPALVKQHRYTLRVGMMS